MTVEQELENMGIPEADCGRVAEKIKDAAIVSGMPNALNNILATVRFLLHKNPVQPLKDKTAQ